jgi:hypothetical protein
MGQEVSHVEFFFFLKVKRQYIKLASRLIKNLPVPLGTLVRKRVRLKLTAPITE